MSEKYQPRGAGQDQMLCSASVEIVGDVDRQKSEIDLVAGKLHDSQTTGRLCHGKIITHWLSVDSGHPYNAFHYLCRLATVGDRTRELGPEIPRTDPQKASHP